ncbi:MAG: DUF2336 domain-containing protein [Minwuiales bacterium]|nr:DUF2336 domain-containing protein [Minwuiales bacterium]
MAEEITLTRDDVAKLLQDPSGETRAATAEKVADGFGSGSMTEQEREIAEEIFRLMLKDAEVRVRQALSERLKENPDVPHDVVKGLAGDVAEVALPVLEFSQVLSDDDLIEIVRSQPEGHQIAVAKREGVSESVSEALADTNSEEVVATLMENDNAEIGEKTFQKVLDNFGESERVNAPMAKRQELPVSVSERLVNLVSDALKDHLVTHHEMSADMATDLILQSRERATLSLLDNEDQLDAAQLVQQLKRNGRLTPTIILRALCLGDIEFFEAAIAELAGVPIANAHSLIFDRGELGLSAIYDKAEMPTGLFPFVRAAVDVLHETEYDGGPGDRERFRDRMIQRVLTSFEDGFDSESFDYLINKLSGDGSHAAV